MANLDAPYGLRPVRHLTGGCVRTNEYTIASGYATSIFTGDPVKLVAGGSLEIAAGAVTDAIGVFWGCSYVDGSGNQVFSKHWPASTTATEIKAMVYDDPDIIFQIQADATGVVAADVGAHADWEIVAGSTSVGRSKTNLDASLAIGATQAGLRVLRIVDDGENVAGAFADVEVQMAQHAFNTVGAGI